MFSDFNENTDVTIDTMSFIIQWPTQDFSSGAQTPEGGAPNPKGRGSKPRERGANLLFTNILKLLLKNCMKMKEIVLRV